MMWFNWQTYSLFPTEAQLRTFRLPPDWKLSRAEGVLSVYPTPWQSCSVFHWTEKLSLLAGRLFLYIFNGEPIGIALKPAGLNVENPGYLTSSSSCLARRLLLASDGNKSTAFDTGVFDFQGGRQRKKGNLQGQDRSQSEQRL